MKRHSTLLIFIALIATASPSLAAVDVVTESSTGSAFASTAWAGNLSSSDLINAGQATLSGATTTAPFFGPAGTNDGLAGVNSTDQNTFMSSELTPVSFTESGGQWWATYNLNVTTNTLGYTITSIESFAGWQANSAIHGNQSYTVEVKTVGSASYTALATVAYTPFTSANSGDHESHVRITDTSGTLATGVDSIRFKFNNPGAGAGTADGTVIREIDVHGSPNGGAPSALTITTPVQRQVIQRGPTNTANIPITGTFTGAPEQIEARAVIAPAVKNIGAIWFIGDSITQSNADGDSGGSPRKSLHDLLIADGYTFSYTGHSTANVDGLPTTGGTAATNLYHYHSGISGSCIGNNSNGRTNMTTGISGWWNQGRLASARPRIVLIMLGTNDIDLNDNVADAPNRIRTLVDTILAQPGPSDPSPAIFVAQIPPNTGSPAEAQRVIDFNNALPAIITTLHGEGKDVTLVDQWTPINANTAGLMGDSLHTNAAGNNVLATQWFNAIDARFEVPPPGTTTAWQSIATAPTGGTFTGALSGVSAGGWYQIEVRPVTASVPGAVVVQEKIGIGDIYITAGQSNSANHGGPALTPTDDRVSARTSVSGTGWAHAEDPMPIASGTGGSVWTRLGEELTAADNIPIGFLCVGVGSTQVSQWQPATSNYTTRLKLAVQSFPANGFRAVLWHQGESDSLATVSAASHATLLNTMIAQSRTDAGWNMPWYLAEAAFHPSSNLSQEEPVTAGQRLSIYGDSLIFLGPSTDEFHLEDASGGKLLDSVHFNTAGLLDHARQWRDILRSTVPVVVRNGKFEDNRTAAVTGLAALADGASHVVTTTSNNDSPSVLGWRILSAAGTAAADGSNGFHNPNTGTYAGAIDTINSGQLPGMDGRHVAVLDGGSAGNHFMHTTRSVPQARHAYTLTVALGVRDVPASFGGARIELLSDATVVASATFDKAALDSLRGSDAAGTFTDASITWNTGTTVTAGQTLAIRIAKTGATSTVLDFDNVRLTSRPPFSTWIGGFGLDPADQDFTDDPDHDGLKNGLEAMLGTDPAHANAGSILSLPGNATASFTHPTNPSPPADISFSYEWSPDLLDWFASGAGPAGGATVTMVPSTNGSTTTVTASPSAALGRMFMRGEATHLEIP